MLKINKKVNTQCTIGFWIFNKPLFATLYFACYADMSRWSGVFK